MGVLRHGGRILSSLFATLRRRIDLSSTAGGISSAWPGAGRRQLAQSRLSMISSTATLCALQNLRDGRYKHQHGRTKRSRRVNMPSLPVEAPCGTPRRLGGNPRTAESRHPVRGWQGLSGRIPCIGCRRAVTLAVKSRLERTRASPLVGPLFRWDGRCGAASHAHPTLLQRLERPTVAPMSSVTDRRSYIRRMPRRLFLPFYPPSLPPHSPPGLPMIFGGFVRLLCADRSGEGSGSTVPRGPSQDQPRRVCR
jgi:hypothetical protein